MALTREQIIENIVSLGEQGADATVVSEYIESEGLSPDDFIQRNEVEPTQPEVTEEIITEQPVVEEQITPINQSNLEKSKAFDTTTFGRVANTINKVLGAITPGEDLSVTEEIERNQAKRLERQERDLSNFGGALEVISEDAKQSLEKTAKFIPWAITPASGAGVISSIQKAIPALRSGKAAMALKTLVGSAAQGISTGTTVAGSKFVEDLASGESIDESIKSATDAGVPATLIGAALPLVFKGTAEGIRAFSEKVAPASKKSAAQINEIFTSVPAKDFEVLLDKSLKGETPLKKPFDAKRAYNAIGKRVQKAINFIDKKAGQEVGKEAAALKGSNIKVKTESIVNKLDEMVENTKSASGKTSLEPKDIKLINKFRYELLEGGVEMAADDLRIVNKKIANRIKFSQETVNTPSGEGAGVLKKLGGTIRNTLAEEIPALAKVNAEFSKIRGIKERLKPLVKEANVARNVKNLYNKDVFTQELFAELDELAPVGLKFQDKLSETAALDAFSQIVPGRGGGSGGMQGFLNNVVRGTAIAGATATAGAPGFAGAVAGLSPAIGGRGALKAASAVGKATEALPGLLEGIVDPTVRFAATRSVE
jgi:hypothetical protein